MVAPRGLVFRLLVKGNEDSGNKIGTDLFADLAPPQHGQFTMVGHSFQNYDRVYAGFSLAYTCLHTLRMGFKLIYNIAKAKRVL